VTLPRTVDRLINAPAPSQVGTQRGGQKYPGDLRDRAALMVLELCETGESHGARRRTARGIEIGAVSVAGWMNQADVN
jgi:hypothetical protein